VLYPIPEGIQIVCEKPTAIAITGIDKQKVGQVAAEIRAFRRPGRSLTKVKGIKYADEFIQRRGRQEEVRATAMMKTKDLFARRQVRTRARLRKFAVGRPRLSVFRSSSRFMLR